MEDCGACSPLQPGGDAPRHPEMQSLMDGGGMLAAQGCGLNFVLEKCQFFHPATLWLWSSLTN